MVENLSRKVKSEEEYITEIKGTWDDIKSLDNMIEFWKSKNPLKIFKEEREKNDKRIKDLYYIRDCFEKRMIELIEEKNRLFP